MKKFSTFFLLSVLLCSYAKAQTYTQEFNNFFNSKMGPNYYGSGVAAIVGCSNSVLYTYNNGMSSAEHINIMSLSKWTTAAIIMMLEHEQKLEITDKVGKYIPTWNANGKNNITIEQLIAHTSGVPVQTPFDERTGLTLERAVDSIAIQVPLLFTNAGSQFVYGSSSYKVVARIAEVIEQKKWKDIFSERLGAVLPTAYYPNDDLKSDSNPNPGYGLKATLAEYANFMKMILSYGKFNGSQIMDSASIVFMEQQHNFDGGADNYGLGLHRDSDASGVKQVWHPGASGTFTWINREKKFYGVIFSLNGDNATLASRDFKDNYAQVHLAANVCGGGSSGGGGCVVNKVKLQFRLPGQCCMDRLPGAKIQGSNNGTSWTDLYTFTSNGDGSMQEFSFGNTTAYSSVRFVASNTGWGELHELEFYNGSTKLSGTAFGTDNYALAFDGNSSTQWHAPTTPGPNNYAGLNLTGCTTTNCNFNVSASANPSSVGISDPVTLSYTCTGTDCGGASFAWSGQGTSGNQSPYSIVAPNTAGNYTYTLTATKTGCTTKTATASITVNPPSGSGCTVNKVKFKFRQEGECCMDRLVGAKIQGSNNGTTWTDLYTFTNIGTGNWQEFTFPNSTAYSSVRFQASSTGWGELYELEFYKGTAKLTGTPFGVGNYANAFDGNLTTDWQVSSNPGTHNHAGLSNLGNCSGSPVVLETDDAGEVNNKLSLLVSPNPSKGVLNAAFYLPKGEKATIVINDLQGRTIYRQAITGNGQHNEKIYLFNKASGIFTLRLQTNKGVEVRKLNIAR